MQGRYTSAIDILVAVFIAFFVGILVGYIGLKDELETAAVAETQRLMSMGVHVIVSREIGGQYKTITGTLNVRIEDAVMMVANSEGTWRLTVDGGLEETTR
jgi:hypothetical protein